MPAPGFAPIASLLGATRRRIRGLALVGGLLTLVAACLALVLFTSALQVVWPLTAAARTALALAGVVLVAGAFYVGVVRPRRRTADDEPLARLIEGADPALRSHVVSAVQLQRSLAQLEREPMFSPALVESHIEWTAARIESIDVRRLVPLRELRGRIALAGLVVGCTALVAVLWPAHLARGFGALTGVGAADVPGPFGRAGVLPMMGDIQLTYRYPAYAALPPRTIEGSDGRISALRGTEVEITARADRDVKQAALLHDGGSLPMEVRGGRTLVGKLVVLKDGDYRFRVVEPGGTVLVEGEPHPVSVDEDRHPEANLRAPGERELEVGTEDTVDLAFDARDDFGLKEIALVYRVSVGGEEGDGESGPEARKVVHSFSGDARAYEGTYAWSLSELQLGPGDRVAYFIEAQDTDVVSGPKKGNSATQYLKVYSPMERHSEVMQKLQAFWEELVKVLADALESRALHVTGEGGPAEARIEIEGALATWRGVDAGVAAILTKIPPLLKELELDELTAPETQLALTNVARDLADVSQRKRREVQFATGRVSQGLTPPERARVNGARDAEIAELEKAVIFLDDMQNRDRIDELQRMTKELMRRKDSLQALMEKHKKAPDDETRAAIEREMKRLKAEIMRIAQKMAELRRGIGDDYVNPEAMQQQDMANNVDSIDEKLKAGDLEGAMKEMEALASQMENMMQELEKAKEEYGGKEYAELQKQMKEFYDGLKEVERKQQEILEKTEAENRAMREQQQKQLEGKMEEFVQQQRDRVEKAKQELQRPGNAAQRVFQQQQLETAERRLDDLDKMLQLRDFDESLKQARMAQQAIEQLESKQPPAFAGNPQGMMPGDDGQPPGQRPGQQPGGQQPGGQQPGPAGQQMQSVVKDLEKLFPDPKSLMTPEARQRMQQLAEEQAKNQQQAGELGQKLDELGKQAPIFDPQMQGMLQQAAQHMGQAGQQLRGSDPRGAMPGEREALGQLQGLREGLEQMGQGQPGGQPGGGMPLPWGTQPGGQQRGGKGKGKGKEDGNGRDPSQRKVEIPRPEDFRVPKELREDILKEMGTPTPDVYKPAVKQYYEDLAK